MSKKTQVIAFATSVCLMLLSFPLIADADSNVKNTAAIQSSKSDYAEYIAKYSTKPYSTKNIQWNGAQYTRVTGETSLKDGSDGTKNTALYLSEGASVTYTVNVPEAGLYSLKAEYFTVKSKGAAMNQALYLNGALPFAEAGNMTLSRTWKDAGEPIRDARGSEIIPEQVEDFSWNTQWYKNYAGNDSRPLTFYLEQGEQLITFEAVLEPVVLGKITFGYFTEGLSYAETKEQLIGKGVQNAPKDAEKIQAEKPAAKSDRSIYASANRGNAFIEPQSAQVELLNVIDGNKFKMPGQWVRWEVNMEHSGFYHIAVRFQQAFRDGAYCSRALLINGQQPFLEAGALKFYYSDNWQTSFLGDEKGNPYLFYFDEGPNTIELQVTLGDIVEAVGEVERTLELLNDCYREIYMITGPAADTTRDYNFNLLIPETIAELKRLSKRLQNAQKQLEASVGQSGSFTSVFTNIIFDINAMTKNHRQIASKMSSFKSNLGAVGEWLTKATQQPISFDWIWVMSPESPLPKSGSGFFSQLSFQVQMFLNSFFTDYSKIGNLGDEENKKGLTVWMSLGRDQSRIVRRMVDQGFVVQQGISVDLQLVASGTLLRSVLAGNSPDVAMQLAGTDPINYALRGAVTDLRAFDDFAAVSKRFNPHALNPFTYLGKSYALPETFSFPMLFYRTDIFEEMGLTVPKTWDEVNELIIQLSAYNMEFGLPFNVNTFSMLMTQSGVPFYNDDLTGVNTDQDRALRAFSDWIQYYKSYGLAVAFDFPNRFRTGEMPVGIADFISTYNQLSVFAPEIKGRWEFVNVPGTLREDGSVDSSAVATVTGIAIMSSSKDSKSAWKYLKWWTDAQTQASYGSELESVLGLAARYASANQSAVEMTAWPVADYKNIMAQWNNAFCLPEVPGGYIVSRYIDFAAREVLNKSHNPGQTIIKHTGQINDELSRKRAEFFDK